MIYLSKLLKIRIQTSPSCCYERYNEIILYLVILMMKCSKKGKGQCQ